jgi:hypothetical protein
MNTVVSDPRTSQFRDAMFKHVVMQKELYDCVENPGDPDQERRFVRDVETFIEIIQRVQGGRTVLVEKRMEELVCDKGEAAVGTTALGISCSARDVPLQEGPLPPFGFGGFLPPQSQLADPVVMNTVATSRQDVVKTMKVDKEHVIYNGEPSHLYLFTEIVEQRGGAPGADTIRPTEKKFQAIICLIRPDGLIRLCHHFIPEPRSG